MMNVDLFELQYPIGKFEDPELISRNKINDWISVLEYFPKRLEDLVIHLSDKQLDAAYRLDGWTLRHVIHHLSDSHHHSYTRFKWALTEYKPVIKAYYEALWANLSDSKTAPISMLIQHLKAIHFKLVYLLKSLSKEELNMSFIHPETNKEILLKHNRGMYAWHSNHHYAHFENLLKRNHWM